MRLINTTTLSLEEFHGGNIPFYAILSHTWGDDEVSFQEFAQATEATRAQTTKKAGYRKIAATCDQAQRDGWDYAWVDTTCIDKSSSAELTEAINSMYSWYQQARVCYVYLEDFGLDVADSSQAQIEAQFRNCRWFTRGWCLQELLAPKRLRFFSQLWQEIGTKSSLRQLVSDITKIPEIALNLHAQPAIQEFPVATRISWIASRQTTRIEDMSYSLLGILNINMPMLYGEGENAFFRLQEEIIRKHNDLSIFAWTWEDGASGFMPILAPTPLGFSNNSPDSRAVHRSGFLRNNLKIQFSLTNRGVFFPSVELQYQPAVPGFRHQYLLSLNYRDTSFPGRGSQRYILLQKVGPGLFIRLRETRERMVAFRTQINTARFSEPVCILNTLSKFSLQQFSLWEKYAVRLRWKPWQKLGRKFWHIRAVQPREIWDIAANQFLLNMARDRYMHVEFVPGGYDSNPTLKYFVVLLRVGGAAGHRDPTKISARIISADLWESINVTKLGFQNKEASIFEALGLEEDTKAPEVFSLVGYDISVSVQLVKEPNGQPHHLVYLDWD